VGLCWVLSIKLVASAMPRNTVLPQEEVPDVDYHDTTFLFTSESVGEGHPGKSNVNKIEHARDAINER